MSFFPRTPARPDRNSNSAFEKLKFVEEHYQELMAAYQDIMAHLKLVTGGSGGDSLWTDEQSDTFIPMYIKFEDTIVPAIAKGMDVNGAPLYYVGEEDGWIVYATPIPFLQTYNGSSYLYKPDVLTPNYKGFILKEDGDEFYIPSGKFEILTADHGSYGLFNEYGLDVGHQINVNSAFVGPDISVLGISSDNDGYMDVAQGLGEWDYAFSQSYAALKLTPYTFNSIKPVNNKHIYLGE